MTFETFSTISRHGPLDECKIEKPMVVIDTRNLRYNLAGEVGEKLLLKFIQFCEMGENMLKEQSHLHAGFERVAMRQTNFVWKFSITNPISSFYAFEPLLSQLLIQKK